jgi:hypothetical protein
MNNLQKDHNSNNMTVTSQLPEPSATNVDALTLQGSHAGDTRGEAQGNTSALRGNDNPVRSQAGQAGS